MRRYHVCPISDGVGIDALDCAVYSTDDARLAQHKAEALAPDYHYGVAIINTDDETIDWGSCVTDYAGDDIDE